MNDPLLRALLRELRASSGDDVAGGVDDLLRASRVVQALGDDAPLQTVHLALRAALARDEAGARVFDEVFTRLFPLGAPKAAAVVAVAPRARVSPVVVVVALLVLAALIGTAVALWPQSKPKGPLAAAGVFFEPPAAATPVIQTPTTSTVTVTPRKTVVLAAPGELVTLIDSAGDLLRALIERGPVVRIALGAAGLALVLAGLTLRRRRRRREAVFVPGPTLFTLRVPPTPLPRLADDDVEDAAAFLTFRSEEASTEIDVERTVEASARSAGRVELRFRRSAAAPVWAVVVQRSRKSRAWRGVVDGVIAQLERAGVRLQRFTWEGDPGLVHDERGHALALGDVVDRTDALLIVGAVDVVDDQALSWLRVVERTPRRLWWNPAPTPLWTASDHAVAAVVPVTTGLSAAALRQALEGGFDDDAGLRLALERAPTASSTLRRLERTLGAPAFRVLCACALAGDPDPAAALWLASTTTTTTTLGLDAQVRLLALPFFVSRTWPAGLADVLVARLRSGDKAGSAPVERQLLRALKNNAPPVGSIAWLRWRLQTALIEARGDDDVDGPARRELKALAATAIGTEVIEKAGGVVGVGLVARRPPVLALALALMGLGLVVGVVVVPSSPPAPARVLTLSWLEHVDEQAATPIAVGVFDERLVVWDADTGAVLRQASVWPSSAILSAAVNPALTRAVIVTTDVGAWSMPLNGVGAPRRLEIEGRFVAAAFRGEQLYLRDVDDALSILAFPSGAHTRVAPHVRDIAGDAEGELFLLVDDGHGRSELKIIDAGGTRTLLVAEGKPRLAIPAPLAGFRFFFEGDVVSVAREDTSARIAFTARLPFAPEQLAADATLVEGRWMARLGAARGASIEWFTVDSSLGDDPTCRPLGPGSFSLQAGALVSRPDGSWSIETEDGVGGALLGPLPRSFRFVIEIAGVENLQGLSVRSSQWHDEGFAFDGAGGWPTAITLDVDGNRGSLLVERSSSPEPRQDHGWYVDEAKQKHFETMRTGLAGTDGWHALHQQYWEPSAREWISLALTPGPGRGKLVVTSACLERRGQGEPPSVLLPSKPLPRRPPQDPYD
ncbi:MAG: hypothetical protein Q8O67_07485 [Deltaproteobacteria bacterium]|nr:hypothetical protein [Deltaproteobacteria bacterium]